MSAGDGLLSSTLATRPTFGDASRSAVWVAAACALSIGAGVLIGSSPLAAVGLAGLAISTTAFLTVPLAVLLGVVAVRSSLDAAPLVAAGSNGPETAVNAAIALGGGLTLLLRSRGKLPAPWVTIPFAGVLVLGLLSVGLGATPRPGLWLALLALLVLFCLAHEYVRDVDTLKRVVWTLLASAIVPVTVAGIQISQGGAAQRTGGFSAVRGTFDFANGLAFYLLVVLTVGVVVLYETRSRWARLLVAAALVPTALAFFITYTRSAWVAAVVVLGLLALLQYRRLTLWMMLAAVAAVVLFPSVMETVERRFADLSSTAVGSGDSSWSWRLDNWSRMSPYALDKPAIGHGLGSYPALTLKEFGASNSSFAYTGGGPATGVAAHNDYLALAVELGLLAPLLWLTVLLALILLAWRSRRASAELRPYATGVLVVLLTLPVISFVDNLQSYGAVLAYVMVLSGAVAGAAIGERSRRRASGA